MIYMFFPLHAFRDISKHNYQELYVMQKYVELTIHVSNLLITYELNELKRIKQYILQKVTLLWEFNNEQTHYIEYVNNTFH